MKLIHSISSFDVFGPEKTVLNECLALAEAGWDCRVVNFWDEQDIPFAAKAAARGVPYTCIGSGGKFDTRAIGAFARLLQDAGRPLVHSHGYKADIYSLFAARRARVPMVTTIHGWTSESLKVRMYERLQAFSWRFFDRVICVSESYRQVARRRGVPERKLTLVPNGIKASYVAHDAGARERARRQLGLDEPHVAVAIIGRLGIEKGHVLFLQAAASVLRDHPHARFLIIGDGAECDNVTALVQQLGIGTQVSLLGHRDDVPALYPAIDVLAITSLREGLPNVLLEAMLHGIPPVATAVGGIPEVVRHGEHGLLVPPQDGARYRAELARIVGDAALRRTLGTQARARILQEYLFDRRLERVGALYAEALAKAG